jgi:hypothetical protein
MLWAPNESKTMTKHTANAAAETEHSLQQLDRLQARLGGEGELAPLPQKASPSFLRFLPKLIQDISTQGAEVAMHPEGYITVAGFYKNGPMRIDVEEGSDQIVAVDRRGRRSILLQFDDLVELNYQHWAACNTPRNYTAPERPWLDHFMQKGWVRRQALYFPSREADEQEEKATKNRGK